MNMQIVEDKVLRILVADDQWEVCSALQLLLSHETGMLIVGQAKTALELLDSLEQTSPDLVLLDWELPGLDTPGMQAQFGPSQAPVMTISDLQEKFPGVKLVALSCRPEARAEALAGNTDAFISKVDPPEVVVNTLISLE
jgi:DNA-binding NarL/FixJ family response regulator